MTSNSEKRIAFFTDNTYEFMYRTSMAVYLHGKYGPVKKKWGKNKTEIGRRRQRAEKVGAGSKEEGIKIMFILFHFLSIFPFIFSYLKKKVMSSPF